VAAAVTGYAVYAAFAWYRYGRHESAGPGERDELLDRFMSRDDVVERHQIGVAAPAEITMAAAREQDLLRVPLVRAIFKARENFTVSIAAAAPERSDTTAARAATISNLRPRGWRRPVCCSHSRHLHLELSPVNAVAVATITDEADAPDL
jgi:hypothetical protein